MINLGSAYVLSVYHFKRLYGTLFIIYSILVNTKDKDYFSFKIQLWGKIN